MKKSINSKRAIIEHLRLKVRKLLNDAWQPSDDIPFIPSREVDLRHMLSKVPNEDGTTRHVITVLEPDGRGGANGVEGTPLDKKSWAELERAGIMGEHPPGFYEDVADTITSHMAALDKAGQVSHIDWGGEIIKDPKKIKDFLKPDGEMMDAILYGDSPLEFHMHGSFDPQIHLDESGRANVEQNTSDPESDPESHPE